MRKTLLLIISLVLIIAAWTSSAAAQTSALNLMDFGAIGDGVADDGPALQSALDALAAAGGGTLFVPAGRYAIITPVSRDFTGLASSITILGVESLTPVDNTGPGAVLSDPLDLVSEFAPKTGEANIAIAITGLQTFLIKDIAFIGTPDVYTDAQITLDLDLIEDATIRHCEFYGLISHAPGGAVVQAQRSRLKIEQSKFLGCSGNSAFYVPVVQNLRWKGITVTDATFLDYGERPEIFGKTGMGTPISWILIGNAEAVTSDSPRREVFIRNVFLDEGAYFGIASIPTRYQPPSAPIDLVYITGLRMNVTNIGASGNYLANLKSVLVERSRYEWSHNSYAAIDLRSVNTAILDQVECLASANRIYADGHTGGLTVINSVYTYLDSMAQTTDVINTDTSEADPVQFVRQQFETLLNRAPDAAGHFYWSDLILRCGDNTQCAADARAALNTYLGTNPSPNFSIAGVVVDENGLELADVPLTLSGSQAAVARTDAQGRYRFSDLPTSGSYAVNLSKAHYTFSPSSLSFITPNGDQTSDFNGTVDRFNITGRLVDTNNVGLPGVTVNLSGSQSASVITDSNGYFAFEGLMALEEYTVTPALEYHTFEPSSWTVPELNANQSIDHVGIRDTHTINGRITRADGSPLSGVNVMLSGPESRTTMTDGSGDYSFADVPAGGNYTVTPAKANYSFSPASRMVNELESDEAADFTGALVNYTLTGRVTSGGNGLTGVTVTLSGSQSGTATTNLLGNYTFTVAAEGDYMVSPAKTHYSFNPASATYDDLAGNRITNFAATLNLHTISGRVTKADGSGLSGVTVTVSGSQAATVTTNSSGDYSFPNLGAGGNYTVVATRTHYTFQPASRTFNNLSADQSGTFVATLNTYSISGRVTEAGANGLSGVTVNLTGTQTGTATTNSNGDYSFLNLPAGGNYTVTPTKTHYTFQSPSRTFSDLSANQSGAFVATLNTHTISGRVTQAGGGGLSGVTVSLSGSQTGTATTNSNGDYSFPNLTAGGDYSVTLTKTHYTFQPQALTFSNLGGNQTAPFVGTLNSHTITGRVAGSGGSGISGVSVNLSGTQVAATTTDLGGNYSFPGCAAGGNYTVAVSRVNYSFNPQSRAFNDLGANQAADFTGELLNYQISGSVTLNGAALAGVTLTLSGSQSAATTAGPDGAYSFTGAAEGSYVVTPSKANYSFEPASISISNLSGNSVGNFAAQLSPGVPVLISEANSTRAVAFDSVLQTREPFQLNYSYPWAADRRTRIMIFATNFDLLSTETAAAVTAEAEDGAHKLYPMTVEYVGKAPGLSWLNCIVIRLHDDLGDVGDVLVKVTYRGASSNRVRIAIGHSGGGPPDDVGAVPTPGQAPQ